MSAELGSAGVTERTTAAEGADVYDDGRLRVEHDNYYAAYDGQSLRFPRTEFLLLSRLLRNAARVVKAEDLWHHAWGGSKPYNPESLHVHIYRLRGKLAPFGVRIEAMINVGYRLMPSVRSAPGGGSTFTVELPRAQSEVAGASGS